MIEGSPDGLTAGRLLRQAREASGLHVAALAVALKVPVRKLEALEEDRLDLLPDAVFVRALASSVCRSLKIDPQPVLERLPQTAAPRLIQDRDGINTPFRAPSDAAAPSKLNQVSKPVVLAVFALLLAALVVLLMPARQPDETAAVPTETVAVPVPVVIPAAPPEPVAVAPAPAPAAVPVPNPPVAAAPANPVPTDKAGPVAAAAPAAAVPPPVAAPAAAPAPPAAGGLVVFRTKGPSWVEVTDAKGVVALRRLLTAGETVGASGALPLVVTVGSASSTEVQVRGRAYDLAPVAKDNVARFEVK